MNKANKAFFELQGMEELAAGTSPVHKLNPLVKFIVTIIYIYVTVSFHKYNLSGIAIMVLYPVLMFEASFIPVSTCFYKMRIVLPLVMAVGIVNPFLDTEVMLYIGRVPISGGVISMITLMLKGVFSLMASFILVATTKIDELCAALRKLHIPDILVTLFLLTYRYISVMMQQISIMLNAYSLRAPGQKGIQMSAWGSFLGQLILRSMDKANELYSSMQLRGFNGNYSYAESPKVNAKDLAYLAGTVAFFVISRYINIADALGNLFV